MNSRSNSQHLALIHPPTDRSSSQNPTSIPGRSLQNYPVINRHAQPFIFIRHGPSADELHGITNRCHEMFAFRIMPSLYYRSNIDERIIHPILERMLVAKVELIMVTPNRNGHPWRFRLAARLLNPIRYYGLLPSGAPTDWGLSFPTDSLIRINYDCEDCTGELYKDGDTPVLPFPASFQCIRDRERGDYHVVSIG